MELIGRGMEQQTLSRALRSKNAEFIAIYGRRRVGKTFLVRQFFEGQGLFFEAIGQKDGKLSDQLEHFLASLEETFKPSLPIRRPRSWSEAFGVLTTLIEQQRQQRGSAEKVIIFLDELPWMATKRSKLLQALDYYWNKTWSRMPLLKLVVCGSAASWMLDNLVFARGGLYNRLTQTIRLKPFTLSETAELLRSLGARWRRSQVLELYMALGGIPQYLRYVDPAMSATQNLDALCFREEAVLVSEFDRLFKSLFDHSEVHTTLIRAIAATRKGVSRKALLKATGMQSGGTFKKRIDELVASSFIERFTPFGKSNKDTHLKVIDEYTLFYLHWIERARRGRSTLANRNYWSSASQGSGYRAWSGYAFEAVCFKHIDRILHALELGGLALEIGSWHQVGSQAQSKQRAPGKPVVWSEEQVRSRAAGAQIDLLIDRSDNAITICEIKHSADRFVIDKRYAENLVNKMRIFEQSTKTRKTLYLALISANGLKRNVWSEDLVNAVVTLDDLF